MKHAAPDRPHAPDAPNRPDVCPGSGSPDPALPLRLRVLDALLRDLCPRPPTASEVEEARRRLSHHAPDTERLTPAA